MKTEVVILAVVILAVVILAVVILAVAAATVHRDALSAKASESGLLK